MTWLRGAGFFGFLAIAGGLVIAACGSSSDGNSSGGVCTAGATQSCVGAGGCAGGQACKDDGSGYLPCDCGGADAGPTTDASSGDAAVDSGGFTPAGMAGLVLWLSADDVSADGGAVSQWPDQSGRGHDLVAGAHAPVVAHAAIDGRDAIKFAPDSSLIHAAPETDFGWGTDNFAVVMVLSFTTASHGVLLGLQGDVSHELSFQIDTGPIVEYFWNGDQQSAPLSTGAHLVAFRRTGVSTAEFHVDDTVTAVPLADSVTTLTPSASIVAGGQDPLYFDGDVAEIIVVHAPTDTGVTNVESYLKSKYGL